MHTRLPTRLSLVKTTKRLMEKHNVPGLGLSVIKEGEGEHNVLLGKTHTVQDTEISTLTLFRAASLSKPVFAFGIFKLIDEGILELDTPLSEYIPKRYVDDDRVENITIRHVFSHSTGFPNWARDRPLRIDFEPGTQFEYSAEGYGYLQYVVEFLLSESLESLMKRLVFSSLEMKHSTFAWTIDLDEMLSGWHNEKGMICDNRWTPDHVHAAGTLLTTSADYSKFMNLFTRPPDSSDDKIAARMLEVQRTRCPWECQYGWSHSFGHQETNLGEAIFHWGIDWGCRNFTINYVDQGFTATLLTNGERGLHLGNELLTSIIGEKPLWFP